MWLKQRIPDSGALPAASAEFFGAKLFTRDVHPIIELSAENCTPQMGVPGPWYERLPHFKMGFTPSAGKELQTEYFVPRPRAVDAVMAVERLRDQITPHLMISEIRTIAADDLWMSPCYRQDCVAIHFTWKQDWPAVREVLPVIEKELAPFGGHPHWGKLFTMAPAQLHSELREAAGVYRFEQEVRSAGEIPQRISEREYLRPEHVNPERGHAKKLESARLATRG